MSKKSTKSSRGKKPAISPAAIVCGLIIISSLSIFNLALYLTSNPKSVLGLTIELDTHDVLLEEKLIWQDFLAENPNYLPGWIELAKLEVQLENPEAAKIAINKAREINPNSNLLKNTEKELGLY